MTDTTAGEGVTLLPCPFCASEGVQSKHPEVPDMVIVGCIDPDCAGHQAAYDFVDLTAAANYWNRRPTLAAQPPAGAQGEAVAWRYRWKPTERSVPGEWREPTNVRWGAEEQVGFEEQPLYATPAQPDTGAVEALREAKVIIDSYFMDDDYNANGALRKVSTVIDAALSTVNTQGAK